MKRYFVSPASRYAFQVSTKHSAPMATMTAKEIGRRCSGYGDLIEVDKDEYRRYKALFEGEKHEQQA